VTVADLEPSWEGAARAVAAAFEAQRKSDAEPAETETAESAVSAAAKGDTQPTPSAAVSVSAQGGTQPTPLYACTKLSLDCIVADVTQPLNAPVNSALAARIRGGNRHGERVLSTPRGNSGGGEGGEGSGGTGGGGEGAPNTATHHSATTNGANNSADATAVNNNNNNNIAAAATAAAAAACVASLAAVEDGDACGAFDLVVCNYVLVETAAAARDNGWSFLKELTHELRYR